MFCSESNLIKRSDVDTSFISQPLQGTFWGHTFTTLFVCGHILFIFFKRNLFNTPLHVSHTVFEMLADVHFCNLSSCFSGKSLLYYNIAQSFFDTFRVNLAENLSSNVIIVLFYRIK